jgi:hypothetical protein
MVSALPNVFGTTIFRIFPPENFAYPSCPEILQGDPAPARGFHYGMVPLRSESYAALRVFALSLGGNDCPASPEFSK